LGDPVAYERDRRATEGDRSLVLTDLHFDHAGILQTFDGPDRCGGGGHVGFRPTGQQLTDRVDRRRINFRFVPLNVDQNIDVVSAEGDLGNSISAAGTVRTGQQGLPAEGINLGRQPRVVHRHHHFAGEPAPRRRLIGVLQDRLAAGAEQKLFAETRRGQASGNYNQAFHECHLSTWLLSRQRPNRRHGPP